MIHQGYSKANTLFKGYQRSRWGYYELLGWLRRKLEVFIL